MKRVPIHHLSKFTLATETPSHPSVEEALVILKKPDLQPSSALFTSEEEERTENDEKILEMVKNVVSNRMIAKFPIFKLVPSKDFSYFEETEAIQIDKHVRSVAVPKAPEDPQSKLSPEDLEEQQFKSVLSTVVGTSLPLERPLWEVVVFQNYSKGVPVLFRVHHALGDGASLQLVFHEICDHSTGFPPKSTNSTLRLLLILIFLPLYLSYKLFSLGFGCIAFLLAVLTWIVESIKPKDRGTIFKLEPNQFSGKKAVNWTRKISVDDCKQIAKRIGKNITVNDVLLTCFSGALSRYLNRLQKVQSQRTEFTIRVSIPVSLRPIDLASVKVDSAEPNRFGFMVVRLPIRQVDPVLRLKRIQKMMYRQKNYVAQPLLSYYISKFSKLLSPTSVIKTFGFLSNKITATFTNVRGISETSELKMCGLPVESVVGFVPPPVNVAFGAMIYTYNKYVSFSVVLDKATQVNTDVLMHDVEQEFEFMKAMADAE